jgi:hypothetical protein
VAILFALGAVVFFSVSGGNRVMAATSIVATIGCAFLFILAMVVLGIMLSLLREYFIRKAVLENAGVGDSFRLGWEMFKRNWKSAGLMWLVMIGIGIGSGIVMVLVFFLLIPAYIIMVLPAAIVAAIPGLVAFAITSIFASGPLAWILGLLVAVPFFLTVMFAPLAFVNGWYTIYSSSVWTLTYREIKALDTMAPVSLPEKTI